MRAKLHFLFSPDVDPLEEYRPEQPDHVGILVQAMIGPAPDQGQEQDQGYESFDFLVCTPSWIAEQLKEGRYEFGHGYLLLPHYDYQTVVDAIQRICNESIGPDWHSIAGRLSLYGWWEFQDCTSFLYR